MTETTHSVEHKPFDPSDPMDAMSENFRRQVTQIAADADQIAIFRDMNGNDQLGCFITGIMTGLITVCFSVADESAHEMVKTMVRSYVDHASQNALGIIENSKRHMR